MPMCGGGGICCSETSSCGSSFIALTARSPATVDAQRLRVMSVASSSVSPPPTDAEELAPPFAFGLDDGGEGPDAGGAPYPDIPFICAAPSMPVLAGGELWFDAEPTPFTPTLPATAAAACGEPFADDADPPNCCCSFTLRSLSISDTHVSVFLRLSTMFWVWKVCPFETASLPVLAATATLCAHIQSKKKTHKRTIRHHSQYTLHTIFGKGENIKEARGFLRELDLIFALSHHAYREDRDKVLYGIMYLAGEAHERWHNNYTIDDVGEVHTYNDFRAFVRDTVGDPANRMLSVTLEYKKARQKDY